MLVEIPHRPADTLSPSDGEGRGEGIRLSLKVIWNYSPGAPGMRKSSSPLARPLPPRGDTPCRFEWVSLRFVRRGFEALDRLSVDEIGSGRGVGSFDQVPDRRACLVRLDRLQGHDLHIGQRILSIKPERKGALADQLGRGCALI